MKKINLLTDGKCVVLLGLLLLTGMQARAVDPRFKWRTLEIKHFRIHYHQGEEPLARRVAGFAEEVHDKITKALGWETTQKTEVVLSDSQDESNGAAIPVPYNTIEIFPTPSRPQSESGTDDNDLYNTLIHEYTHIVHLEMAKGAPAIFRRIFGRVPSGGVWFFSLFPNFLEPDWMVEGLATFEETEQTSGGRGRSSFFNMMLRMAFLENRVAGLDQMANSRSVTSWPSGTLQYLYGESFYRYLVKQEGPEKLKELHSLNARRLFPYFRMAPITGESHGKQPHKTFGKVYGQSLDDFYAQWKTEMSKKYQDEAARIKEKGLTDSIAVTQEGFRTGSPSLSPDGQWIVYRESNADRGTNVRLARLDGKENKKLFPAVSPLDFSWSSDGKKLLFVDLEVYRDQNVYGDLYSYDMTSRRLKRLTRGQRVTNADWGKDGVCVLALNESGRHTLVLADPTRVKETLKTIVPPQMGVSYDRPVWSPDGQRIAVAVKSPEGISDIWVFSRDGVLLQKVTQDSAVDSSPAWSPDGQSVYFVSDRSGVANVYRYFFASGELKQITNVLGGAFEPAVSLDGKTMAFTDYSSGGFDVRRMDLSSEGWTVPLHNEPPAAQRTQHTDYEGPSRPYNPGQTLLPRYWAPMWDGSLVTGGADVLEKHSYSVAIVPSGRVAYDVLYDNNQTRVPLSLDLFDDKAVYSGGSLHALIPLRVRALSFQALQVGFNSLNTRPSGLPDDQKDKLPKDFGLNQRSVFMRWLFDNTRSYGYSIIPESGRLVDVKGSQNLSSLGADRDTRILSAQWTEFARLPWNTSSRLLNHQSLALTVGQSVSDEVYFSQEFQGPTSMKSRFFSGRDFMGQVGDKRYRMAQDRLDHDLSRSRATSRALESDNVQGKKESNGGLLYAFPLRYVEAGTKGSGLFFIDRIYGTAGLFSEGVGSLSANHLATTAGIGVQMNMNFAYGPVMPAGSVSLMVERRIDKKDKWVVTPMLFIPLVLF